MRSSTFDYRVLVLFVVGIAFAGATACRRREEKKPIPAPERTTQPITFDKDADLVFIYVDVAGKFHQAPSVAAVPSASRKVVRVIDPTVKASERSDYGVVHVADLTSPDAAGRFGTRVVGRVEYEARALAALPPGAASRVDLPRMRADGVMLEEHDDVIIYGTSWCGACKQAREFLAERRIPYIDKDVERDPRAAAELAAKAAQAGISADRVPIIDVRGRILVGFDAARVATLLGEQL